MKYFILFVVVLCCLFAADVEAKKGGGGKAKRKATKAVMQLIKFCMLVVNETNSLNNTNSTFDDVWEDVYDACDDLTVEYEEMKANVSTQGPAYKKPGKGAPAEKKFMRHCMALEKAGLFEAAAVVQMRKKPQKPNKPDVLVVLADHIAMFEEPCDTLDDLMNPA